uniref:Ig-like domain-containing protein n=1 Tax=Cyprinus carpio TaxID=7962 RepID=A0A8C1PTZ1_CYPCA
MEGYKLIRAEKSDRFEPTPSFSTPVKVKENRKVCCLSHFILLSFFTALPRSTLTVTPDSVFTGERVILTCEINSDHSDWRYEWYKDGTEVSERHTVKGNTLTIERSETSDAGLYTCKGHIDGRSVSSQSSSAVYLSVTERPKAVVKVTPDQRVFRGETVTLTCDIQGAGDIQWTYSWFKDGSVIRRITERVYTITSVSDRAEYRCRGERSDSQRSSFISAAVTLTVSDLPTSTLTVTPDNPVFTGERVDLKCMIESHSDWRQRNGLTYDRGYDWTYYQTAEWRYEWYKGSVMLQTSERYTVNRDTLTIRGATESDQDQFWCRGQRDERPNSSQSSSVSLTVTDSPRSTLTVTPYSPVFTGERVILKCVIESHSNWRYVWYKGSVMLQSSERYTVNTDTLTIRGATESDQDQFWCRGQRDERPNSSQSSSAVPVTVKDSPTSTLTVTPDSPVFTGERVSLKCEIESYSNWRYEWHKDSVMLQTSERYTVNRDTLTITAVTTSDAGQFWCRGQRDKRPNSSQSSSVPVTVKDSPTSTLTVTPDSPVFTGERVSLKCVIESRSNWRYEWYKDSVMLQTSERYTVNTDTLTIRGATESDQDQFWCRGQRDERPKLSQSSSVSLTVTARPKAVVKVNPDQRVFRGETVTLTCDIQRYICHRTIQICCQSFYY